MNILTIDIKVRSCISIKTNGIFAYAQNKSTQAICLTVKKNQASPMVWLPPELRRPEILSLTDDRLRQMLEEADIIQAFDVITEFAIWKYTLCRLYPWFPKPPFKKLSCIAARAAYIGMNFLPRNLIEELDIALDDLPIAIVDPRIFSSPNKKISTEALSTLIKFSMNSVRTEEKIAEKIIELPPMEQEFWRTGLIMNDNGIFIPREIVVKQHEKLHRINDELYEEFKAITGISNPVNVDAVLSYFNKHGIPLKNLDNENVDLILRSLPNSRMRRVLEIRELVAQNNPLRFILLLSLMGEDSRVRGLWEYHGNPSGAFRLKYLSNISDLDGLMAPEDGNVFRICRVPDLQHNVFSVAIDSPDMSQIMTARYLQDHCKTAVKFPGRTIYYGRLKISSFSSFLKIVLPSGRDLYLYKPELEDDRLFCQIKFDRSVQRKEITGSFIYNLLIDAMNRDVVMSYLMSINQYFFTSILTTSHDIVTENAISFEADDFFQDLISNTPSWLQGNFFSPVMCMSTIWNSES